MSIINLLDNIIEKALYYYDKGILVLPARPDSKAPALPWKEFNTRKPSREETVDLFRKAQTTFNGVVNIGTVVGPHSGISVLDFDTDDSIKWGIEQGFFEIGPIVITGSGKRHVYVRYEEGLENLIGTPIPGFEFRAKNLFVILPPSIHPETKKAYQWVEGMSLDDIDLPKVPDILINECKKNSNKTKGRSKIIETTADGVGKGQRHITVVSIAAKLFHLGSGKDEVLAYCLEWNRKNDPPATDEYVIKAVKNCFDTYFTDKDKKVKETHSDAGNARLFVREHGEYVRFVYKWNTWLIWNDHKWEEDSTGEVMRLAKETIIRLKETAENEKDLKHAIKSEQAFRLEAMLKLAQSESGIPLLPEHLDSQPYLFNVANGTIDLITGELLEHNPENYITKISMITYDPVAKCPLWDAVLQKNMAGNVEVINYLQKAIGYCLSGDISEKNFHLGYGRTNTGKSKVNNTILDLLGEYGIQTSPETFMLKKYGGGINNDIARLRGARFVSAIETEDGQRLAENIIKQLTGTDPIVARYLYKEFFQFQSTAKIWIWGNHKPIIHGTDDAIWERVRLIPFATQIKKEEQDPKLDTKLHKELSGILNWALFGFKKWQREGLSDVPKIINEASKNYQKEMDTLGLWIEECCEVDINLNKPSLEEESTKLFRCYNDWALANNFKPVTMTRFGRSLTERGFLSTNTHSIKHRTGIKLTKEVF